ncbi:hypothetical protein TNCV_4660641 [Trichonephila clavipes]|uniref:Uncharacterized protein n=1 Tax=Trichonephila clavipes TaxID=2585209 RepID=A0A8X6SI61_TRICX|nr:hypothetical protein TNCV_4660641 [Trichonephila clavipes]
MWFRRLTWTVPMPRRQILEQYQQMSSFKRGSEIKLKQSGRSKSRITPNLDRNVTIRLCCPEWVNHGHIEQNVKNELLPLGRPTGIVVSDADCGAVGTGCRATSPLVRLVEGEERWAASGHPQGILPQNWGETELNRSVTCMVLKSLP